MENKNKSINPQLVKIFDLIVKQEREKITAKEAKQQKKLAKLLRKNK